MAGTSFEEKVAHVLAYKRSNTYPEGMNKTDRRNLRRFSANFSLEEGTLFYSAKERKVVVVHTMDQALQLFKQYHDSPQGGHVGKVKTRIALTSRYYWPGMTKDITGWYNLEMCKKWGIECIFTSPGHPLTNGFAHSTTKSIKRALRKFVDDTGSNWDEFLDGVLFSLRSHVHMTTKMSPFRLLYGFEARFPSEVSDDYTLPNFEEHDEQFYKEYCINSKMRKDADIALALSNIAKAAEKNRRYAQERRSKHREITFEAGDCYGTEYEKKNKKRKTAAT
ncbi:hypothetical protein KIL84_006700 [Mauremys mutica]|uniref:Gypsy retrotransposon integrase-like protein 1 n=1 Tax=Mauremys mutica TaxID=74926 RepID=A0A9D3WZU9_9SAUR|nr:hypothetical protein KIL84_006700 [Mauremys mutica]